MSQWAHKILDNEGKIVFLNTVFPDGRAAFYYMLLSRQNRSELFEKLKGTEKIDLEKFGKVVRSGWGEPTEEDKEFMRRKYKAKV